MAGEVVTLGNWEWLEGSVFIIFFFPHCHFVRKQSICAVRSIFIETVRRRRRRKENERVGE
jgi:hypothetical protein